MKKFFARNGELLFVVLIVVLILTGLIFYTLSGGDFGLGNRNNSEQTTQQESGQQHESKTDDNESVRLNDGRTFKVGDTMMVAAPTYNEVMQTIEGKITKIYPERKRALLWEPNGVVEFTYRYVIELQASRLISSNGPSVGLTFTDTIRSVVMMNEQGEEVVHFLQNISNPAWEWRYAAVRIDDTDVYTNRHIYNVVVDPSEIPDYIKKFYEDNAPKSGA